jgi:hypothetical protein
MITNGQSVMEYKEFEEARNFVRNLKFKTISEWKVYCDSGEKPIDIPSHPITVYKNKGFVS